MLLQYLASLAPDKHLAPADGGLEHWRLLEVLNFIATELHKGFSQLFARPPEEWQAKAIEKLKNRFALLEQKLGDKAYLRGDFGIADAYAFVMLQWATQKFAIPVGDKLEAYRQRIANRPAVRQALAEEA